MEETEVKSTSSVQGQENFVNTTGLVFPHKYLSTSQINKYLMCPMSYYWEYVEGKREPANSKLVTGNVTHKVLEILSDAGFSNPTDEELRNVFDMGFRDEMDAMDASLKTEQFLGELEEQKEGIYRSLSLYGKHVFPTLKIVAQEVQVDVKVPVMKRDVTNKGKNGFDKLGDMTFVGFIDFLNYKGSRSISEVGKSSSTMFSELKLDDIKGDLEIGDYKTGQPKDHTYFSTDTQSPFYAYATGIPNVRIDNIPISKIRFKKDGSPYANSVAPSCNVLKYKVDQEDYSTMLMQYSQVALGIGSGAFPMCSPSFWKCGATSCGHWSYCRGKSDGKYVDKVAAEKYEDVIANLSKKS